MRFMLVLLYALTSLSLGADSLPRSSARPAIPKATCCSPIDLAVLADGRRALALNHASDLVSLLDLKEGKVLAEHPCGHKPVAIACSHDGTRAAVSNLWSGGVTFLEIQGSVLKSAGHTAAGAFPRGLAFAPNGQTLFVAVAGQDEVIQLDWKSHKVLRRWPAPCEPRQIVLSADGRLLGAASSLSGQVRCWETQTGRLRWERTIEDGFNLRGLAFTPDGKGMICVHALRRAFPVSRANIEEGWVIDNRLTWLALRPDEVPPLRQIALDTRGQAVGDPAGAAFGGNGRWLAITGSGTHELLLLDAAAIPWNSGDPGDFLDPRLATGAHALRRVPLGGRPLAIAFLPASDQLVVANYLLDAVQIVDGKAGKLVRTIPLGLTAPTSLVRQGEALFYDAQRSHHQWFSCHTCHVDGHTCGLTFDTLNDDSYGNPKLTPTLRNVTKTGPWTWHGWQKDLGAGVEKSFTQTMFGPRPTAQEIKALLAFLATLEHPPNPRVGPGGSLGASALRGQALFHGAARCARCHQGENYTSEHTYDVQLEPDGSPYLRWNPPSLRGLYDRGPYLHDGRVRSLNELLREPHAPEKLGGRALTGQEQQDLLEFLLSL
jgi:DNA-binding beta-propeller fold protein YncE